MHYAVLTNHPEWSQCPARRHTVHETVMDWLLQPLDLMATFPLLIWVTPLTHVHKIAYVRTYIKNASLGFLWEVLHFCIHSLYSTKLIAHVHRFRQIYRYILPHSAHRHSFVLLPWVCTMLLHQVMEELALAVLSCKQDAVEGSALQVWGARDKKATQFAYSNCLSAQQKCLWQKEQWKIDLSSSPVHITAQVHANTAIQNNVCLLKDTHKRLGFGERSMHKCTECQTPIHLVFSRYLVVCVVIGSPKPSPPRSGCASQWASPPVLCCLQWRHDAARSLHWHPSTDREEEGRWVACTYIRTNIHKLKFSVVFCYTLVQYLIIEWPTRSH